MNTSSNPKPSFYVSLWAKLLISFAALFIVIFAGIFYWFYTYTTARTMDSIQDDLKNTLVGAIAGVNTDDFVGLVKEGVVRADGYTDDPRYWAHVSWLQQVHTIEPRAYLYTYIRSSINENDIVFVGSNGALFNPPDGAKFLVQREGKGMILLGLQDIAYNYNFQTYEDEYGKWVSGYAPIKNAKGEVVGAMGVDFKADYVNQVQQEIVNWLLFSFLITSVVILILAFLVSNSLARPIRSLTQIAGRIGEGKYEQNLSALTQGRFRDEISTLAMVFVIMIGKVSEREKTLRSQVEQLQIIIDETKRQSQVNEIVDTDFFRDLQSRADVMRSKRSQKPEDTGKEAPAVS